jgi:hypothetical protein
MKVQTVSKVAKPQAKQRCIIYFALSSSTKKRTACQQLIMVKCVDSLAAQDIKYDMKSEQKN